MDQRHRGTDLPMRHWLCVLINWLRPRLLRGETKMKLFIVIAFDPEDGPYVATSNTCEGEAGCSASEVTQETGHKTKIKMIEV